jgi:hypothetical protein
MGSPSKGTESVIRCLPQVPWESPHSHLCRYLGKATKVTNSQSASGGYSRQSGPNVWEGYQSLKLFKRTEDKWTGRLQRTPNGFRVHEAPRPNETSGFSRKTPNIRYVHYDWLRFGGVICFSPTCDLMFIPCVRGGSLTMLI